MVEPTGRLWRGVGSGGGSGFALRARGTNFTLFRPSRACLRGFAHSPCDRIAYVACGRAQVMQALARGLLPRRDSPGVARPPPPPASWSVARGLASMGLRILL